MRNRKSSSSHSPYYMGNKSRTNFDSVPFDNVGNWAEQTHHGIFVDDGLGNSTEGKPAHLESGILHNILQNPLSPKKERNSGRIPIKAKKILPSNNYYQNQSVRPPYKNPVQHAPSPKKFLNPKNDLESLKEIFLSMLSSSQGEDFVFNSAKIALTRVLESDVALCDELKLVFKKVNFLLESTNCSFSIEQEYSFLLGIHSYFFFVDFTDDNKQKNKQIIDSLRKVMSKEVKEILLKGYGVYFVLSSTKEAILARAS